MIALLMAAALAADPAPLRMLTGQGPLLEVGSDSVGVAAELGTVRVSASYGYGSNVALHVGRARVLLGEGQTWGVDAVGAVGLAGLLATPGAALVVTGELRAGARGERGQATVGLVAPLAVRLGAPLDLALPVALELRVVAGLGPVWVGLRGQAGATFAPGAPPAARAIGAGFVELRR